MFNKTGVYVFSSGSLGRSIAIWRTVWAKLCTKPLVFQLVRLKGELVLENFAAATFLALKGRSRGQEEARIRYRTPAGSLFRRASSTSMTVILSTFSLD